MPTQLGEACLFPNLLPLDRYTGVCVMSERHFIAIHEFTPEIMKDAFTAALSFIKQVARKDPGVRFFNINWNYMSPAGSSIIHPHLQVNSGEIPTRQARLLMESSHNYFWRTEGLSGKITRPLKGKRGSVISRIQVRSSGP